MKVKLDNDGYIEQYVLVGENPECDVEITEPENFDVWHFHAYRVIDGICTLDKDKISTLDLEAKKNEIRQRREKECYAVINRGQLWYEDISLPHLVELRQWYKAWRDAPATLVIPERPEWLD